MIEVCYGMTLQEGEEKIGGNSSALCESGGWQR